METLNQRAVVSSRGTWQQLSFVYAGVIAVSVVSVVGLTRLGESWFPIADNLIANSADKLAARSIAQNPLVILVQQLLVIVVLAQVFACISRTFRQPRVIGELAAGVLLGPSLVGRTWPQAFSFMFPPPSMETFQLLGQLGVILYMFIVGMDVNVGEIRRRAHAAIAISHFSIAAPFVLGVLSALVLYRGYAPGGIHFTAFALFMGIAMSITAFPVLARILDERGLTKTPLGAAALACAAVDDVSAWILLALVVGLVTVGGATALLWTVAFLTGFLLIMVGLVKPILERIIAAMQLLPGQQTTLLFAVVLASSLTTERLGLHALFGAFVAGTVIPANAQLRDQLRERFGSLSGSVLLPVFFASTGLRTNVALLNDRTTWILCIATILIAIAGKLGGSMLAARWTGFDWHDAFVVGALMNTRGLMELVALNVGYDLGILSPTLFTILVLMALTTTAMTSPLIDCADALRLGLSRARAYRSLSNAPS